MTSEYQAGHTRHSYIPSGFFMLRTPLLPFDAYTGWAERAASAAAASGTGRQDRLPPEAIWDELRQQLRAMIEEPVVQEALYLASPVLFAQLPHWRQHPDSERSRSVEQSLIRYFARMAGRATPFGLFAGWTTGRIGEATDLRIGGTAAIRRRTRLDAGYLSELCESIAMLPDIRRHARYYTNSSLYEAAGRLRYAEASRGPVGRRYSLVQVAPEPYLVNLLDYARIGVRYEALLARLCELLPDVEREAAASYLDELIDSQLLLSELSPIVTGKDQLQELIQQYMDIPSAQAWGRRLRSVSEALQQLDDRGIGQPPASYQAVIDQLTALPAEVTPSSLFQVDMSKPSSTAMLGAAEIASVLAGIEALRHLVRPAPRTALSEFRERYAARYGDCEMPLAEVLDEELGIGFAFRPDRRRDAEHDPSPLLEGLEEDAASEERTAAWTELDRLLLRKLIACLSEGQAGPVRQLELHAENLASLKASPAVLADAFAAMISISADDPACTNGRILLHAVMGPSGARMLGRFCDADPELEQGVLAHLRQEERLRPDAIFAEIVHLPEGRMGNIIARPRLRDHEIGYLCRSTAEGDKLIALSDLLVSVRGDRIRLRSRRLGREIIPRMSNALTYQGRGLAAYRFLGELQGQDVTGGLRFEWGPLADLPDLPRVVYGRVVLARARWNLSMDEIQALDQHGGEARFRAVQEWRARRGVPRYVVLTEFDHELPVDLDNRLSVDAFVELAYKRAGNEGPPVLLMEQFPDPSSLPVEGPDGRYMNELIIPFAQQPAPPKQPSATHPFAAANANDILGMGPVFHAPGSEWLYAKLYASPGVQNQALAMLHSTVIDPAVRSGAVDRWFFIRYGDPDLHLRIRLHGEPQALMQEVLPLLHAALQPWMTDRRLARWQLDTYEPETIRYGGPDGLPLAERLFHADSEAVAEIMALYDGSTGLDTHWRLAIAGVHMLLDSLGLDGSAKRTLIAAYRDAYDAEFRSGRAFRKSVSRRFRQERGELEALLRGGLPANHPLQPGLAILRERTLRLKPIADALAALDADPSSDVSIRRLAPSFIHMHVNRMIRSSQREHEHVLYDLLSLLYDSLYHKERTAT